MSSLRIVLGILLVGYRSHAALRTHPDITKNEFENIFGGEIVHKNSPFRHENWPEYNTPEDESGIMEKRYFAERQDLVKFTGISNKHRLFLGNACEEEFTCKDLEPREAIPLGGFKVVYKFNAIGCECIGTSLLV